MISHSPLKHHNFTFAYCFSYLGGLSPELLQSGPEWLEKPQSSEGLEASILRDRMRGAPIKGPGSRAQWALLMFFSGNCKGGQKAGEGL